MRLEGEVGGCEMVEDMMASDRRAAIMWTISILFIHYMRLTRGSLPSVARQPYPQPYPQPYHRPISQI